jgi:beta-glucanase (GH16 family)
MGIRSLVRRGSFSRPALGAACLGALVLGPAGAPLRTLWSAGTAAGVALPALHAPRSVSNVDHDDEATLETVGHRSTRALVGAASDAPVAKSAASAHAPQLNEPQASSPQVRLASGPRRHPPSNTPPPTTTTTTQPPAPSPPPTTSGPTAGKTLAFASTFGGGALDTGRWAPCYPWFKTLLAGCTNFGNSQEEEWYLPSQDQVSGGALHMVAEASPTQGWTRTGGSKTYAYRSGMVTTFSSFQFTYGYVQVVAKLPGGAGTWPALWLLPETEAWPPEIDIMENWGTAASFRATLHWATGSSDKQLGQTIATPANLSTTYHTYGLLWQPGSLTWYFDGTAVFSITGGNVPSQPMYFLADLAVDGPAASGSSFDIQSVKIYTGA